MIDVLRANFN